MIAHAEWLSEDLTDCGSRGRSEFMQHPMPEQRALDPKPRLHQHCLLTLEKGEGPEVCLS